MGHLSAHKLPTIFRFGSRGGISQENMREPIRSVALRMLEEVAIHLQRYGRIGVTKAILDLGDRRAGRDHRRCAAMAKGVKSDSPETGSR
jgi:hypothetical protein